MAAKWDLRVWVVKLFKRDWEMKICGFWGSKAFSKNSTKRKRKTSGVIFNFLPLKDDYKTQKSQWRPPKLSKTTLWSNFQSENNFNRTSKISIYSDNKSTLWRVASSIKTLRYEKRNPNHLWLQSTRKSPELGKRSHTSISSNMKEYNS